MNLKNIICFETEKEGRLYRLTMPEAAPLEEAYEVASAFLGEIARQNDVAVKKNAKKEEEKPEEEEKSEESE